jgi:hypothetical protein
MKRSQWLRFFYAYQDKKALRQEDIQALLRQAVGELFSLVNSEVAGKVTQMWASSFRILHVSSAPPYTQRYIDAPYEPDYTRAVRAGATASVAARTKETADEAHAEAFPTYAFQHP